MTKRQREAAKFWTWPLATIALLFGGAAFSQQNNDPRGSPYSSIANQALEQCFDSTGTFLCLPAGGGAPVGGSGTFRFIPKWTGSSTLGDSNIREYGASEVTLGYNNTNAFLTLQDRTVAASNSALSFDYDIPVADGSDQMMGASFSIGSGAKAHTGSTNSISIVVASGHDGVNPNIDEYAFHARGGTSGYAADYRAGQSAADTGIMSAPAGFQIAADTGPPPGFSDSVFSFTSTGGLNVMDGGDTVAFVDIDITNADHTGSTNFLYGANLALDVADAETAESALRMTSTWDNAISWDTGSFSTSVVFATPTADRTATFPDATGTLALAGAPGTTNTVPKWTAASTLGDSGISDDGTDVVIDASNSLALTSLGYLYVPTTSFYILRTDSAGLLRWSASGQAALEGTLTGPTGGPAVQLTGIGASQPSVSIDNGVFNFTESANVWEMDGSDTINFLNLRLPTLQAHTGANNTMNAININNINASANSTANAMKVEFGFDNFMVVESTGLDTLSFAIPAITAPRTYSWPDATGTVALVTSTADFLTKHGATEGVLVDSDLENAGVPAAGDSGSILTLTPTLNAMDGAGDIVSLIHVDLVNADHTAGNLYGMLMEIDTQDPDATEAGVRFTGGWDYDLDFAANADFRIPDSASFLFHGASLEGLQMNINAVSTENYNFGGTLNGPGGDIFVNILPDTVEAMDGSDTQYLFQISVANADHTGASNFMYGANIVLDTADADATEVGMRFSGWDYDFQSVGTLFANLGTPADGTFAYCSDCAVANPCAGSGSGAFAMRLNSVWVCRETAPAYGELYVSSATATNTTSGTPVKAAGTTTLGHAAQFDMPANNQLRYTGSSTEIFACQANTSFVSSSNPVTSIFLADNGSVDATSEIARKISTGVDEGAASTGFIVELAQNEHVELWIDTSAGDPTVTINHMTLRCAKVS